MLLAAPTERDIKVTLEHYCIYGASSVKQVNL